MIMPKVFALHRKLLDIAARLEIHIIFIGSDGAAMEFQAQNLLHATQTRLCSTQNIQIGINFNCPVIPKVGPVVRIQDPKHGKNSKKRCYVRCPFTYFWIILLFDLISC